MRPTRETFRQSGQTYFITFQTAQRQCFFRNERWALALIETFGQYASEFDLHDFVVMPDHVHLLVSPQGPLERSVQLIKGGYSFKAKRAFDWKGDIWQAGFSDHRIRDAADYEGHLGYIERNVCSRSQEIYPYCGRHAGLRLAPAPPWLKPPEAG
jgi:putative transposase